MGTLHWFLLLISTVYQEADSYVSVSSIKGPPSLLPMQGHFQFPLVLLCFLMTWPGSDTLPFLNLVFFFLSPLPDLLVCCYVVAGPVWLQHCALLAVCNCSYQLCSSRHDRTGTSSTVYLSSNLICLLRFQSKICKHKWASWGKTIDFEKFAELSLQQNDWGHQTILFYQANILATFQDLFVNDFSF